MADVRDDRGSAVPLTLIVVAAALLTVVAVGHSGRVLVDRQRAQAAADAVALAAAVSGEDAARAVARANGAHIIDLRGDLTEVVVTVGVGSVRATARAERPRASLRSGSLHSSW